MAKSDYVELAGGLCVPILYEDRSVMAIDKPAGWVVEAGDDSGDTFQLQVAVREGIARGWYWARSRNLKFLRFVHRLDLPTTGVLLASKSAGAVATYSELFAGRLVQKRYLAVVEGLAGSVEWNCQEPLGPVPGQHGRHQVDRRAGKEAETQFRVLARGQGRTLLEAFPRTGRTHQIRLHLLAAGLPVVGDALYGRREPDQAMALRAVGLEYRDPFTRREVRIRAPAEEFLKRFGFSGAADGTAPRSSARSTVRSPGEAGTGQKTSSPSSGS